jgi:hypothetical protein
MSLSATEVCINQIAWSLESSVQGWQQFSAIKEARDNAIANERQWQHRSHFAV